MLAAPTLEETRRENRKRHDRFFFLAVAAALVVTLLFGWWSTQIGWLVLFVPALVMTCVLFAYRSYCRNSLQMIDHDIGDNVYYLGFLFTLASLISGLIALSRNFSNGADAVVSFLPAFGTALITTLVGMAMRVVMTQRDPSIDLEAQLQELRKRIQESAADMKTQVDAATDQFAAVLRILREKVAELPAGVEGLVEATRSVEANMRAAGTAASTACANAVREVEAAANGAAATTTAAFVRAAREVEAGAARVGDVVGDTILSAAKSLGDVSEKVSSEAQRATSALTQGADATGRAAETLDASSQKIADALGKAASTLEDREQRSGANAERLVRATERIASQLEAARTGRRPSPRRRLRSLFVRIFGARAE